MSFFSQKNIYYPDDKIIDFLKLKRKIEDLEISYELDEDIPERKKDLKKEIGKAKYAMLLRYEQELKAFILFGNALTLESLYRDALQSLRDKFLSVRNEYGDL